MSPLEEATLVDLFVSRVGLSHRNRDDVERRFQNPAGAAPIELSERVPLLLGVWQDDRILSVSAPILVLADARRRAGRTTRWSVFVALTTLTVAQQRGWASQRSESGELILAFRPELLALAVEAAAGGGSIDDLEVQRTIESTGIAAVSDTDEPLQQAQARLRRATSVLVRDARFSRSVLEAYGHRCAMCGLGLGLVEAAHLYPASAPGSSDRPTNGVALCANHHRAFDRHEVAIDPGSLRILLSPTLLAQAQRHQAARSFVDNTFEKLAAAAPVARFDVRMLEQRYEYYTDRYLWLS